jgi:two-component system cell cycle sensor histidine kinase/response regulator CckA
MEGNLQQEQNLEALKTLAGGIAHNFNNLNMGIQGNTSLMLLETDPRHPNYEKLKRIEKLLQKSSKLISQLLGYAGEGRCELEPIRVNQLVKETAEALAANTAQIRIHLGLADNLYGIMADSRQIEQILLNLCSNAVDAMPKGGDLYIETANVTDKEMTDKPYEPKPGNYVVLTVTDTGVGMDKEILKHIFEPFFSTKGVGKGMGLGLASVYGIVKAQGGYIDVHSKKGHGTTFRIYIPAFEPKTMECLPEQAAIRRRRTALSNAYRTR